MAVKLVTNVQAALNFLQLETHCWLDSTVALYWIKGPGTIGNSFQTEYTRSSNTTRSTGITSQLKIILPTWGVEEVMQ